MRQASIRIAALMFFVTVAAASISAQSQVSEALSFQGFLTDSAGVPINAPTDIDVVLYDSLTGGNQIWYRAFFDVPVVNGLFSVMLEGGTPALENVDFGRPMFVQLAFEGQSQSPRTPLASAPYALALRGFRAIKDLSDFYGYNLIGGHPDNRIDVGVKGGVISGGGNATYWNRVAGDYGTISGGQRSHAAKWATVPGGSFNTAGAESSFAAGYGSTVRTPTMAGNADGDVGTFIWSDRQPSLGYTSTGPNQFLVRAEGGFGFGTNDPQAYLHVARMEGFPAAGSVELRLDEPTSGNSTLRFRNSGNSQWDVTMNTNLLSFFHRDLGTNLGTGVMSLNVGGNPISTGTGAYLSSGGVWTDISSRTVKHGFEAVDPMAILDAVSELDVQRWRYNTEPDAVHMGPVAEDFHEAFGLGAGDQHIAALDGNGVALAAIQALHQLVLELQEENEQLRNEIRSIR